MYGTNPFSAQAASNGSNLSSRGYPSLQSLSTYVFRSPTQNLDTLNCNVIGPGGERRYCFVTGPSGQGYTLLKTVAGVDIAIVQWQSHPTVEAHGICTRQFVGEWLRLTPDRSSRTMIQDGVCYSWAPINLVLHLFAPGSSEWLARVTRSHDAVILELSPSAIKLGLTNVAILATALLQCGRNID